MQDDIFQAEWQWHQQNGVATTVVADQSPTVVTKQDVGATVSFFIIFVATFVALWLLGVRVKDEFP